MACHNLISQSICITEPIIIFLIIKPKSKEVNEAIEKMKQKKTKEKYHKNTFMILK
jgi:hypothetical protein